MNSGIRLSRARELIWLGSGGILRRILLPQFGWALLIILVGFAIVWPVFQLEQRAFADGASAFSRMLALPNFGRTLRVTILLAVGSGLLAVVLGVFLAWCAASLPPKVRQIGQILPLMPLVLPPIAAVTGWIFLLSPRVGYLNALLRELPFLSHLDQGPFDIYTVSAIVIITAINLSSFVFLFVHTGLQNMGQEMEDAAAASGASPMRRLFTITIPLLRPSIVYATSIVFLLGLGQFTVPLLLGRTIGTNVLTTEMYYLTVQTPIDYGLGAALGFPILAVGFALVIAQKLLLRDQKRFVVVSARARHQVRKSSWLAAAAILIYATLVTLLPLIALIYVSISPFWSSQISFEYLTLNHYRTVFNNPLFLGAIWTSVIASVAAVAILIPVGFACAFALLQTTRINRQMQVTTDVLVTLPNAIPASLLGFGFLFAYSQPPLLLYGTYLIIVVAYATLMIGYSTRLQLATQMATGQEFREASRASGAGAIRSFLYVMFPLTRKGIFATAALSFVLLSHEFSASMMVRSVNTQVMGSLMYDILSAGVYGEAAVLALIMVVVTLVGVLMAVWMGGADSLKKL